MFGLFTRPQTRVCARRFCRQHLFLRKNYTPPFMLELPAYKPRACAVAIGLHTSR
jgi:hypothetical protein